MQGIPLSTFPDFDRMPSPPPGDEFIFPAGTPEPLAKRLRLSNFEALEEQALSLPIPSTSLTSSTTVDVMTVNTSRPKPDKLRQSYHDPGNDEDKSIIIVDDNAGKNSEHIEE